MMNRGLGIKRNEIMIIALVTLYNPDEKVRKHIIEIGKQVDQVILCDNSPKNNEDVFVDIPHCRYFFFARNLALSGAFNRILKNNNDFKWNDDDFIIFFDQDSSIEENHIAKLIDEYIRLTDSGYKVGCIGPVFFNRSTGKIAIPKIKKEISKNSFAVKTIITSSMVTTYGVLKQVGFWNEKLFLDLADWDLCLRMENKNYLCVESKVSILNHAVGNGFRQVLFFKLNVESNLVREFYQTRNCLYLLTKKYVPLRYKLRFLLTITVRPVLHLLFLEHGVSRMKYVIRGYQSFFARDTGEYRLSK